MSILRRDLKRDARNKNPFRQMKGAVYDSSTGIIKIEKIPVPKISSDEILLKVDLCGVCGTDRKKINYNLRSGKRIFGHEIVGTIEEKGKNVSGFETGNRVVVFHHVPCEECSACKKGNYSQCETYQTVDTSADYGNGPSGGGFAEFIRVPHFVVQKGLLKIPDDISFEDAVNIEPLDCVRKGVLKAEIEKDSHISVIGMGYIGFLTFKLALQYGAKLCFPVDIDPEKKNKIDRTDHGSQYPKIFSTPENFCKVMDGTTGVLFTPKKTFVAVENLDAIFLAALATDIGGTIVFLQDLMPEQPFFEFISHYEMSLSMEEKLGTEKMNKGKLLRTVERKIESAESGEHIIIEVPEWNPYVQKLNRELEWNHWKGCSDEEKIMAILKLMEYKWLTAIGSYSSTGVLHRETAEMVFDGKIDFSGELVIYIPLEELPNVIKESGKKYVVKY